MSEIEFYWKETDQVINKDHSDNWYFVMSNRVFRDTGDTAESQEATVSFDNFIIECQDVGWRIKGSEQL